jgi:hypothetical protein
MVGKVQAEAGELAVLEISNHSTILESVHILDVDRKQRLFVIAIVGSWFLFQSDESDLQILNASVRFFFLGSGLIGS